MRKREGMEPRNVRHTVGADLLNIREGHIKSVDSHDAGEPTGVRDRSTSPRQSRELGRSAVLLSPGGRVAQPVNGEDTQRSSGSRMPSYEHRSGVTPVEQRKAQTVADSTDTPATRRGGELATTGVESIATRARSHPAEPFTALMHHFSVDNLRACFAALDGRKALGVDGVSKDDYGQQLESNLQALHEKLCQQSYRPQPVRRVEIPKADGSMRPLGISCTEDKIVQEMVRRVLEAIYEPVFLDTSYGFRPGRSAHDALRRVNQELMKL